MLGSPHIKLTNALKMHTNENFIETRPSSTQNSVNLICGEFKFIFTLFIRQVRVTQRLKCLNECGTSLLSDFRMKIIKKRNVRDNFLHEQGNKGINLDKALSPLINRRIRSGLDSLGEISSSFSLADNSIEIV